MQISHLRIGLPGAQHGAAGEAAHTSTASMSVTYLDVNQFPLERPAIQPPCPCLADQLTELHPLNGECVLAALHKALQVQHLLSKLGAYDASAGFCLHVPCQLLRVVHLGRRQPCQVSLDDMPVHDCASAQRGALNSSTQLSVSKSRQTKR